jgi:hypothetical protein
MDKKSADEDLAKAVVLALHNECKWLRQWLPSAPDKVYGEETGVEVFMTKVGDYASPRVMSSSLSTLNHSILGRLLSLYRLP